MSLESAGSREVDQTRGRAVNVNGVYQRRLFRLVFLVFLVFLEVGFFCLAYL
jgi:hypothetical protein